MRDHAFDTAPSLVLQWMGKSSTIPMIQMGPTRVGQSLVDDDPQCASLDRILTEHNARLCVFLKGLLNRSNALRKKAGSPGGEAAMPFDLVAADSIARIPRLGVDPQYDF